MKKAEMYNLSNEELVAIYQDESRSIKERDDAVTVLIENNMGLIMNTIKKYNVTYKTSWDYLIQAGRTGIFLAAKRYNPEKYNTVFATYAVSQIAAAVSDEVNKSACDFGSNHYVANVKEVKRAINEIQVDKGIEYFPTSEEIQQHIRYHFNKVIPKNTIESCIVCINQSEHLSTDVETYQNYLPASTEDDAEAKAIKNAIRTDIQKAVNKLPPEERFAYLLHSGFYDGITRNFFTIAVLMNKRPEFVERHNGRPLTAFFAQKFYNNAIDALQNEPLLKQYVYTGVKFTTSNEQLISDYELTLLDTEEADEIATDIFDNMTPEDF